MEQSFIFIYGTIFTLSKYEAREETRPTNPLTPKSVSKTCLNTYSICRRHIYKRKPLSKTKHIAYNIKGHLSACKRRSFRRQKVVFCIPKGHLSSYIYLSAGQLCLCHDIRTRHKPTVRPPTLTQYIRTVCAIRDIIIAHGGAGGVSTDNSP